MRTTPRRGIRPGGRRSPTRTPRPRARTTTRGSSARSIGSSGATRRSAYFRVGSRGATRRLAYARVGVQAGDEDLHDQDVERQAGEAEQLDVVGAPTAPAGGGPGVQERRVEHPGDEGPGLHRIPAPAAAPRLIGPDRARDDAEGPDRETEHDGPVGEPVDLLDAGQPAQDPVAGLGPAG